MCKEGAVFLFGNRFLWCCCSFNSRFEIVCYFKVAEQAHLQGYHVQE